MKKNKRGAIVLILFFLALLCLLIIGFIAVNVMSAVDIVSDELTPVMEGIGMVGGTNLSQASEQTFGRLDSVVQVFPMIIAFGYIMALVFTIVIIYGVGYSPNPAFLGLYVALMILLIFGSIVISNMYQDISSGNDSMATRLKEQSIMSFFILYSPLIMTIIAIFGGIIMFARNNSIEYTSGGYV